MPSKTNMADLKSPETPESITMPLCEKSTFKNRTGKFISEKKFKKSVRTVEAMKMKRKLTYDSSENGLSRSETDDSHSVSPRKKRKRERQVNFLVFWVYFLIKYSNDKYNLLLLIFLYIL